MEPGRFVLLGSGLLGFAGVVRRKFLRGSSGISYKVRPSLGGGHIF